MTNFFKAFLLLSLLTFTSAQSQACPKKHRALKAVGRGCKNGIVGIGHGIANGFRFVRDKVMEDLDIGKDSQTAYNDENNSSSEESSESRYTSYND